MYTLKKHVRLSQPVSAQALSHVRNAGTKIAALWSVHTHQLDLPRRVCGAGRFFRAAWTRPATRLWRKCGSNHFRAVWSDLQRGKVRGRGSLSPQLRCFLPASGFALLPPAVAPARTAVGLCQRGPTCHILQCDAARPLQLPRMCRALWPQMLQIMRPWSLIPQQLQGHVPVPGLACKT